jgi:aconitate hydratase 2/2-methylisocitrate dehydratase
MHAKAVIASWANAEWFTERATLDEKMTLTVFKVPGETNTDDLSPAPEAWSRRIFPACALDVEFPREGVNLTKPGNTVRSPGYKN